jgi:glutamate 5-kinase
VSEPARELFRESRRWVVKIGSALLTADGRGIDQQVVDAIVAQLMELRARGCDTVLVSSGAVAAGLSRLGWSERPGELPALQAAAAVGQSALLQHYEQALAARGVLGAQVLLGHDDIEARDRYLNARATLSTLLEHRVIPVVNENDTVVTDEIRFGDNDTLAALVANLVRRGSVLVLLTDQDGLFSAIPGATRRPPWCPTPSVTDTRLDNMVGEGGAPRSRRHADQAACGAPGSALRYRDHDCRGRTPTC